MSCSVIKHERRQGITLRYKSQNLELMKGGSGGRDKEMSELRQVLMEKEKQINVLSQLLNSGGPDVIRGGMKAALSSDEPPTKV